jgi:hypothetical protein
MPRSILRAWRSPPGKVCFVTTSVLAVRLYAEEVVRLHGIPSGILSNRDMCFQDYWEVVTRRLGSRLLKSPAFHPQTDSHCANPNTTVSGICGRSQHIRLPSGISAYRLRSLPTNRISIGLRKRFCSRRTWGTRLSFHSIPLQRLWVPRNNQNASCRAASLQID